jgi:hypothetical protein
MEIPMKSTALEKKLIAAARAAQPDDHVPYAFEKRIMARLRDGSGFDVIGGWASALWRAAAPCCAVALLIGAWSLWDAVGPGANGDFPDEFETAVLSMPPAYDDSW